MDMSQTTYHVSIFFGAVPVLLTLLIICLKLRKRFPVKDGDYNKEIPAMYDSSVNNVVGCQQGEFLTASNLGRQFCVKCHGNNHLKVKLLAGFSPLNWDDYDNEFMIHKENIEKSYGTCVNCQMMVDREIEKQDHLLSRKVVQYHQQKAAEYMERNSHKEEEQEENIPLIQGNQKQLTFYIMKITSVMALLLMIVLQSNSTLLDNTPTEQGSSWLQEINSYYKEIISNIDIQPVTILGRTLMNCTLIQLAIIIGCIADLISKRLLMKQNYILGFVDLGSFVLWFVAFLLQYIFSEWSEKNAELLMSVMNLVFTFSSMVGKYPRQPIQLKIARYPFKRMYTKQRAGHYKPEIDTFAFGTPINMIKNGRSGGLFDSRFISPEISPKISLKKTSQRPLISPAKFQKKVSTRIDNDNRVSEHAEGEE
ncbi:unnamed protein product [Mytilus coruscus]|uniref:Ima1 N-terminal domain-containing protein n=1 Tax=Mytilus coruscus TaxID=42192 RepID=A0A6J8F1R8_MYTCO|nr:unnamed protein product [Mytilus coruscus]CAC5426661.1 unnamed protein product [Mytilus coruscus]